MMIVGLTGGIGSGKTTVGKFFAKLGVPVYNSDIEAKRLMNSSKKLRGTIIELLGEESYIGKKINRELIASRAFVDKNLLQKLNNLVHPAVRRHFLKWLKRQNSPYVIQEAAILFENGSYTNYDKIILVRAPKKVRIIRIKKRDGSSEHKILARMKNQWKDSRKSKLSDYIIENIDLEKTESVVRQIHGELVKISS